MVLRLIEYHQDLYIVLGIGYNAYYDPPDIFLCIPLAELSIIRSILTNKEYIQIPIAQAIEITDKKRIQAIWILYGQ